MDKNSIKKYAIWARRELIERVSQKALQYGISESGDGYTAAELINGIANGKVLSDVENRQRHTLIKKIQEQGYEQVMEEVAYTWFNRFCALRFMEVNGYLPTHVRVFTDEENQFKPQILAEAINLDLDGLDMDKVYELKDANKTEELYKYLLIVQCNALSAILPHMFQRIEDYTELLLPDYLLREGSVIERMVSEISEDNFNVESEDGQIEIIGWLYQYYISEKHEEVIDPIHGKVVKKEEVPAATQLFTTDWVVRYLIDNSVGRYWIERNPESRLANQLAYFVKSKDGTIKIVNEAVTPQEITVFDPCVGSGHFLIYAFDVLIKIYVEYGFAEREAVAEIVKNNLFGIDIDGRAAQLAYFSVMMKARQYDRRFFNKGIQPNIYEIVESNNIDKASIEYFYGNDATLKKDIDAILHTLKDAKEYGAILQMPIVDFRRINERFVQLGGEISIYNSYLFGDFQVLVRSAEIMSGKYAVVATNPPYLNKYDANLKEYIIDNYKEYSGDLFSVFIYRNLLYVHEDGYTGFMTPFVWMFIKSYEKLREYIISYKAIITLVQLEYSAFEEATVPICIFVLQNYKSNNKGLCFKLSDFVGGMEIQKEKILEAIADKDCGYFYEASADNYNRIAGSPIAFWASEEMINAFENNSTIAELSPPKQGLATANNDRFLRLWYEIQVNRIGFGKGSCEEAKSSGLKWFPYNKGGAFRRWYGNRDYVVDWENDGYEIKNFKDENGKVRSRPQNLTYYFREAITWSDITSASFSGRYSEQGFMFDIKGSSGFPSRDKIFYVLGFLNSSVSQKCIKILNPTITTQVGDMARIPVAFRTESKDKIDTLVNQNIGITKNDWDSFETSWDFKWHPLVINAHKSRERSNGGTWQSRIEDAFFWWENDCETRFQQLKANEEELNRIFINIYGLQDELTPEVNNKDVTVRKADLQRDIKSLISYAVGCMFGRYSPYKEGLIYAGGDWDSVYGDFPIKAVKLQPEKYHHGSGFYTYGSPILPYSMDYLKDVQEMEDAPDFWGVNGDNIIPISDDEYFENDIVNRFEDFLCIVYGAETLNDNLKFIADALGGKGQPKEVIRNYFLNDFFTAHCKIYQKRPIYWLFDSGKKNGFKCLIYMHRYKPDTIARIRTDYVHEQQSRYRTAMEDLEKRIMSASTGERVKLNKQLTALQAQAAEIKEYEEKIHHLADQMIHIDLDDGVKVNYAKFQDVLAKIK